MRDFYFKDDEYEIIRQALLHVSTVIELVCHNNGFYAWNCDYDQYIQDVYTSIAGIYSQMGFNGRTRFRDNVIPEEDYKESSEYKDWILEQMNEGGDQ